ncbi:MAG: Hydroxypyruvate isomerase [Clostridiales bacterium]|nr:Hydroxypyruvate isomerase [Clostridiales bacterium]
MKKSVCIETVFTEVDFDKRFKMAKEAGFDYIEFWSWRDKDIERIKHLYKKYDLKIASFSGDKNYSMVDKNESSLYIAFLEDSIKAAKFLECEHLVIHSNALGEGGVVLNGYEEVGDGVKFATMFETLSKLAPIAEEAKITLVLEALNTLIDHPGNFLAYTKDSVELIKMVNSRYIKVLYDVYHMQIMEGNIIDNIKRYLDYIGYIHIADVPCRQEPGTGEINYSNVIKALRTLNFGGIIGFELFPSKNSVDIVGQLISL